MRKQRKQLKGFLIEKLHETNILFLHQRSAPRDILFHLKIIHSQHACWRFKSLFLLFEYYAILSEKKRQ